MSSDTLAFQPLSELYPDDASDLATVEKDEVGYKERISTTEDFLSHHSSTDSYQEKLNIAEPITLAEISADMHLQRDEVEQLYISPHPVGPYCPFDPKRRSRPRLNSSSSPCTMTPTPISRVKASASATCLSGMSNDEEDERVDVRGYRDHPYYPPKPIGLDDFELLRVLGKGSFAKVVLVKKKGSGELHAMKVIRKEAIVKSHQIKGALVERTILQEMQHPFIVKLQYAFQTQNKLYLVLDFLAGGELFFHLRKERFFPEEIARFYAAEITLAIGHLHRLSVIYRDLKPENVLLDSEGHCRLTDFGLAKAAQNEQDMATTFCGTIEYMAPEILLREAYGPAVDWWSLGCLIYEMLTGQPPFHSRSRQELYAMIIHMPVIYPSYLSDDARSLLKLLLQKDPSKRLGTGAGGCFEVMQHPFFSSIDWISLIQKDTVPPFQPKPSSDYTIHFDPEFTRQDVADSPTPELDAAAHLTLEEHFRDFDYQRPEVPME